MNIHALHCIGEAAARRRARRARGIAPDWIRDIGVPGGIAHFACARRATSSGAPEVCVERRSCHSGAGLAGMLIAPLALLGSRLVIGVVADNVSSTTLLFWDLEPVDEAGLRNGAQLTLNKPQKLGRVLRPEYPWEAAELGGYDTVMKVAEDDYRFYYLCNADWRMTPQRTCMAHSTDGRSWTKSALHAVSFDNSTANNIVWPLHSGEGSEPGSTFIDSNPASPPAERFKMVLTWDPDASRWPKMCDSSPACVGTKTRPQCCGSGQYTLVSADGIHFVPKVGRDGKLRPAYQGSDTQQTGHWDPVLSKYVIFVRGHQAGAAERTVLRCVTSDVTNWASESPVSPVCPTVLAPDSKEHYLSDYYTSGATAYGPVEDGNVVFFPTPYRHFSGAQARCACPEMSDNCGIIDIRFAFSRSRGAPGTAMLYVPVNSYLQPSSDLVELSTGRSGQKFEPPISGLLNPAVAAASSSSRRRAETQEILDVRLVVQRNPTAGTSQHPPQAVQAAALLLGDNFLPLGQSVIGTGVGQSRAPFTSEHLAAEIEHCRFRR
eukprot:COSAG02_NODE_4947_length_4798_cov_54.379017_3_plen_548_part_00